MVATATALVMVAGVITGVMYLALTAGLRMYGWIRGKYARPLTEEEKWQETAMESMSEEEWSALLASVENEVIDDEA
jgi:hypothetical protein